MASTTVQIPSLCIPRVYFHFDEAYIEQVFCVLFGSDVHGKSCVERIDLIKQENRRTGEQYKVAFLHFVKEMPASEELTAFIQRIESGEEVKIEYRYPWFWNVHRGPRIIFYQPPALAVTEAVAAAADEAADEAAEEASKDAEAKAAELHGPLTEEALRLQRKQNPMRPLRLLPIGVKEKDSSEFKQFRRASLTNDYPIQFVSNPKQITGQSYKRYETYCHAKTLREVLELSTRGSSEKQRQSSRNQAMKDITWDALHGYIIWPQHEHVSPQH